MIECRKSSRKIGQMRTTSFAIGNTPIGERMRQSRRGSADDEASRGEDGYDLLPAALSVGALEEAGQFILRSGVPEIGEGDGDLS